MPRVLRERTVQEMSTWCVHFSPELHWNAHEKTKSVTVELPIVRVLAIPWHDHGLKFYSFGVTDLLRHAAYSCCYCQRQCDCDCGRVIMVAFTIYYLLSTIYCVIAIMVDFCKAHYPLINR